jgi:hypothetical protein
MFRCAALAILAFTALAGPAFAQTSLQWKFKEGDKFYLEEKIVSDTNATVLGMKNNEKQTQHRVSVFVVKSVTPDGYVLEQRVESWKSKTVSTAPGAVDDGGKLLEQVFKDIPFVVKMTKSGTITKFEGYDKVLQRVKDVSPAEAEQFKALATEEVIRSPLTMAFDLLPDKAVNKGDKWKKVNDVPMAALGKFSFNTEFTYEGKGEGGQLISTKGTFSFMAGKGDIGMGIKLLKMELTKNQQTGTVLFDADKGRLVSRELKMPMAGTMTLDANGLQIDVQLDGTENRTIRLHDKKPMPDI